METASRRLRIGISGSYGGMNLGDEAILQGVLGELRANAADFLVERFDAEVVFVPMEKLDVQHSHAVVAHMRFADSAEILRRRYSSRQILDLMGRFDFAVGMRLHFLIFAALRGTPFAWTPRSSAPSASAS